MFSTERMQLSRHLPKGSESGQATVELAVILPFIVFIAAGLIQCGLIVANQLTVWNAARSAARAASISPDPQIDAQQAANSAVDLRPLQVTITTIDDVVSAHVVYIDRTNLPLIGVLFPEISLEATVAMLREIPTQ